MANTNQSSRFAALFTQLKEKKQGGFVPFVMQNRHISL